MIPGTSLLDAGSEPTVVFTVYAQHINTSIDAFLHEKLTTSKTFTNNLRVYHQDHDALPGLVVQSMMDPSKRDDAMDKGQQLLTMRDTLTISFALRLQAS